MKLTHNVNMTEDLIGYTPEQLRECAKSSFNFVMTEREKISELFQERFAILNKISILMSSGLYEDTITSLIYLSESLEEFKRDVDNFYQIGAIPVVASMLEN